jgi:hypothetical protein
MPQSDVKIETRRPILQTKRRQAYPLFKNSISTIACTFICSQDIDLRVLYKPEIEVEEVFIHTKAGNEVELVCTVHAMPHATVTWKKDSQPISPTDRIRMESRHSRLVVHFVAVFLF